MDDPHQSKLDQLLVVRCRLGEPDALDELVDRWHGRMWAFVCRSLAGDDAVEETVQELWLRVLRGLPRLRDPSRFGPWIYRIARLAVVDRLRRKYSDAELTPDDDTPLSELTAEPVDLDLPLRLRDLDYSLARLAWPDREVVTLFYAQELSLQEVAEVLDIPQGTVKSRLHRARKQLKNYLEPQGEAS